MKIIKKIDCLNMIANGNGPERFISDNCLWYKGKSDKEHYYGEGGKCQLNFIKLDELNDEIELFEDESIGLFDDIKLVDILDKENKQ